jgi:uncharacterized membrane protein
MQCPRCQAVCDEDFCPQCGLDLGVHRELTALKKEVAELRAELARSRASVAPDPEQAGEKTTSPREQAKSQPPPLPGAGEPARSAGERDSGTTEIAVGQKWFLGLGVVTLLLGAGFFLKYAFDSR